MPFKPRDAAPDTDPLKCPACGMRMATADSFDTHVWTTHPSLRAWLRKREQAAAAAAQQTVSKAAAPADGTFVCAWCTETVDCKDSAGLLQHMKQVHPHQLRTRDQILASFQPEPAATETA